MTEKYPGQGLSFQLSDKHFFALYLNLAQNNLSKILEEFEKIYPRLHNQFLKDRPGEWCQKLHQLLPLTEDDAVLVRERLNYLRRTLPFIRSIFQQGEYAEYRNQLIHLFARLHHLRNYFSHGIYQIDELNEEVNRQLFGFLDEIKKNVLQCLNTEPYALAYENLIHLADPNGFYNFLEERNKTAAINFLICLFLDRKTAMEFLKVQRGYKGSASPEHRATLACYTQFSAKLPKPVLESADFEFRFVLDGINELKRCPRLLFHHLSEENRELCRVDAQLEVEEEDGGVRFENAKVDLIRYEDRFPYFALRYLDEMNLLPKIRFQVCVGHRKEKFHTHENETEPVVHHKKVYAFARLHDLLQENPYIEPRINEEGIKEYRMKTESGLENFAPSYAIHDQNIKFVIDEDKFDVFPDLHEENPKAVVADGIISIYELKNLVYACLSGKEYQARAQNLLINQVKNYQNLLRDIQEGIFPDIDFSADRKSKEEDLQQYLQSNYRLSITHIPKQIRRSLLEIKQANYREKALRKLEMWHRENEENYYRLKHYLDLEGTPEQPNLKQGSLASELTRDIQFFLPEKFKLELFQYRELQRALAFYQSNEIKQMLRRDLQLSYYQKTDRENRKSDLYFHKKHPFLHKVFEVESFNPRARKRVVKIHKRENPSLFHFAFQYYKQKRKWLGEVKSFLLKQKLEHLKVHQGLLYYFKLGCSVENGKRIYYREYGAHQLKNLIGNIASHQIPVNMPGGLFHDILMDLHADAQKNASRQIESLFPETQPFYRYERQHPVRKEDCKLEQIQTEYWHLHHKKYRNETEEKHHKSLYYFLKEERKIRYHQNCDRLLWQMIQTYLQSRCVDIQLDFSEIDLSEVSAAGSERSNAFEEKKVAIRFPVGQNDFCIHEKWKNFGRIARYRYDSRFVSLYAYKGESLYAHRPEEEVHAKIVGALQEFTSEQWQLFEAIIHFERFMEKNCSAQLQEWRNQIRNENRQAAPNRQSAEHYFSHRFLMQKALEMGWMENENQMELLIQARNSAAHNRLNEKYLQLKNPDDTSYFGEAIQLYKQILLNYDPILR